MDPLIEIPEPAKARIKAKEAHAEEQLSRMRSALAADLRTAHQMWGGYFDLHREQLYQARMDYDSGLNEAAITVARYIFDTHAVEYVPVLVEPNELKRVLGQLREVVIKQYGEVTRLAVELIEALHIERAITNRTEHIVEPRSGNHAGDAEMDRHVEGCQSRAVTTAVGEVTDANFSDDLERSPAASTALVTHQLTEMNLTREQMDLLSKIVDVYESGDTTEFIVQRVNGLDYLLYTGGHPTVPIHSSDSDFRQLATENLLTLNTDHRGLSGKPTEAGIGCVAKFRERSSIRVPKVRDNPNAAREEFDRNCRLYPGELPDITREYITKSFDAGARKIAGFAEPAEERAAALDALFKAKGDEVSVIVATWPAGLRAASFIRTVRGDLSERKHRFAGELNARSKPTSPLERAVQPSPEAVDLSLRVGDQSSNAEMRAQAVEKSVTSLHAQQGSKGDRRAKRSVRRNAKYEVIDEALREIAVARPKNHEEVFQFLDGRKVAIPNREPFKSARGWLKGFQQNTHAASAWLSQVWGRLGLPAFARGPKK